MAGESPFLDGLFKLTVQSNEQTVGSATVVNFTGDGAAISYYAPTNTLTIAIGAGGTFSNATLTGTTTVTGPMTVDQLSGFVAGLGVVGGFAADTIASGPWTTTGGQQTTTGNSTITVAQLPVGSNRIVPLEAEIGGDDGTFYFAAASVGARYWTGTSPGLTAPATYTPLATFPIPVSALVTLVSGHIRINVTGPQATVSGCASNGDSPTAHVRVAVNETLVSWASTIPVDISGIVGTTEANVTNGAATYVDSHHFDLLAVAFVDAYVSGGLVLEHGNGRVITWVGRLSVTARTP
jgi:hypothetical protein